MTYLDTCRVEYEEKCISGFFCHSSDLNTLLLTLSGVMHWHHIVLAELVHGDQMMVLLVTDYTWFILMKKADLWLKGWDIKVRHGFQILYNLKDDNIIPF